MGRRPPPLAWMGAREVVRALRAARESDEGLELSVSIELYTKDLQQLWLREAAATGSTDGFRTWALHVLAQQDFSNAQSNMKWSRKFALALC